MQQEAQSLDIQALLKGYRNGRFTPADIINLVCERAERYTDHNIWITRLSRAALQSHLDALAEYSPDEKPLYGIPFAIKDNIDVAGVPTTAGCPEYAYTPQEHAFVVRRLIDAGAIPIGKTNLDQFATGLVGTRSPYGACCNSFDTDYISGGSSAGSAVAVALGLASFSLGTDTAGSGRVPAAFNNLIGVKPTRGVISTRGVVPACRSLDCISIFALTCDDAARVLNVGACFDDQDAFAREQPPAIPDFDVQDFRFGVPRRDQLVFFGNDAAANLFDQAVERLAALGGEAVDIDFEPFLAAARLLYEGPWVSERYLAIEPFISSHADALHPVTRSIIEPGKALAALEAFRAQYRLAELKRSSEAVWEAVDVVLTPTAGTLYRIAEVEAEPVALNSNLGYYTNFMNLLDLSAIAVSAGFQPNGLPFGVTLFSRAFVDAALNRLADRLHRAAGVSMGAVGQALPQEQSPAGPPVGRVSIAVCGAHLTGLPLNAQLTERGARLLETTRTASDYRLYALAGGPPRRPGLVRDAGGVAIEVEVWAMPRDQVGGFLELIPAPLGLGKVELADGRWVNGFICEPCAIDGAEDVSAWGGWRSYLAGEEA